MHQHQLSTSNLTSPPEPPTSTTTLLWVSTALHLLQKGNPQKRPRACVRESPIPGIRRDRGENVVIRGPMGRISISEWWGERERMMSGRGELFLEPHSRLMQPDYTN